jgi:hypothetical protein
MYQVTGDVTAHYSTISLARTGFSRFDLVVSAIKVMLMAFNITIPNPNYGTWYIVHTPFIDLITVNTPSYPSYGPGSTVE